MNIETGSKSFASAFDRVVDAVEPYFVFDGERDQVLWANAAAIAVLGIPRRSPLAEFRFDHAMPALAPLRDLQGADFPAAGRTMNLVFWTASESQQLTCECRRSGFGHTPEALLVRVLQRNGGRRHADQASVTASALETSHDLDHDATLLGYEALDRPASATSDAAALREIARLIREGADRSSVSRTARVPDADDDAPPAMPPSPGWSLPDLARALDILPLPIALLRGGVMVHVNRALLEQLGYASPSELRADGGLISLVGDGLAASNPDTNLVPGIRAGETLRLRSRKGGAVLLEARSLPAAAVGERAIVLVPAVSDTHSMIEPVVQPAGDCANSEPVGSRGEIVASNENVVQAVQQHISLRPSATAESRAQIAPVMHHQPTLLAKVSHELRTPLSAIMGFAEIMKEEQLGPIGSAKYKGYALDIFESAGHALSLVNDLQDLTTIEAGAATLTFSQVDVEQIIKGCVGSLQPIACKAGVTLSAPDMGCLPQLIVDRRSLKQMLLNLLSNALKCTDAGGTVSAMARYETNSQLIIQVRDTGVGMTLDDVKRALQPFGQVGDPARRVNSTGLHGTGLGLPLTKALAEANGAILRIDSVKGSGTVALLVFPTSRLVLL